MHPSRRKWLIGGSIAGFGLWLTMVVGLVVFVSRCDQRAAETPREYLESDHAANFERIFDKPVPEDVSIVNSLVVAYEWRLGVVTTDDWEIELLAPRKWVEELREELHLVPVARDWPEGPYSVAGRKQDPFRPWYAPRPLEDYEPYWLQLTSIPYRHMLVQREPEPDGRLRVFVSKH
ncbi:MAG: hypothetical protein JNN27_13500 [Planctomycetes bacterium]|nr:hypothetical protein [Planctomycetota bacterium]